MHVAAHHTEQHIQRLADQELRADLAKRLRTVLLAQQGFTAPEIATCTGFSRRSVQIWVERYNREGLLGLNTQPGRGRKSLLTAEQAEQLQQRLDAGALPENGVCTLRGKDVRRILEREFGQLRSLNTIYGLLHRLGFSSLVPRHPQADPAAQDEFKKNLTSGSKRFKRNIPAAGCKSSTKTKRGSASKVTLTRVWARTGSRPRAVRQMQYGYVYVLGAACAATGQAEGLIAPRLDTGIVNVFLAQLSRTLDPDVQAVLV